MVSGLISERQLIHTPTWKNLKFYSICPLIYNSVSPKNSNISNKFKKLLNTISCLKFTYDLCCVPHVFVMCFFHNALAHYKKMHYLVVHNTRKYWQFLWCIGTLRKIGTLQKNGRITKIHDALQKKLVPKTCKLVPETTNKNHCYFRPPGEEGKDSLRVVHSHYPLQRALIVHCEVRLQSLCALNPIVWAR